MKRIDIKYNPYSISNEIKVNGKLPKENSSLYKNGRLQEWAEHLPKDLLDEFHDCNLEIHFTGTQLDYDDLRQAFEANKKLKIKWIFDTEKDRKADISDVEKEVERIFTDIQNGPIPELKDSSIKEAFLKAQNSQFEINVLATMSSGKSNLINALLGKNLMPAANTATTATIVRIISTEQEEFSAIAYDKSGNIVENLATVSLNDMDRLNSNETICSIDLKGKIPFVSTAGMKLVLIDTPGPNNSRDERHRAMTYKMLSESDKSLVLYLMNGEQLGINDNEAFLDFICEEMKKGGKQTRDRYIFAVNRMDRFKPWPIEEGGEGFDCVKNALKNVQKGLEERGIILPNIFPVTALVALQQRTNAKRAGELVTFRNKVLP